jgi:hypothetical protein
MSLLSLIRIYPPETSGPNFTLLHHPLSTERRQSGILARVVRQQLAPMKIRSTGPSVTLMLAIAVLLQPALGKDIPVPAPKPKPAGVQAKPKPKPAHVQEKPKPEPAETPAKREPPAKPSPEAAPTETPRETVAPPPPSPADLFQSCLSEMRSASLEFQVLGKVSEGRCTLEGAVALQSVVTPGGKVELPARPRLSCAFALKFGRWIAETAAPIIAAHAGASLKTISTGAGLECRKRNGESSGKLSEHARGNAIDVASFELTDRRRITVGDADMAIPLAVALKGLRTSACGYFTTVLGPGSNEAHKDHLHFDSGLHGRTDNYRICE